jgi:hypothetical protein
MTTHHINILRLANYQKGGSVFVGAIADLNVTAFDDTTITLDWTTPSADNPIDYYEVYLNGVFYENTTDDTEGWTVTGLTAGTSYNIKLKTVDTLGNKSGFSNAVTQSTTGGVSPIYDGVSTMYSLRRPAMTTLWTNAVLKIRRSSDNATAFVFFDGADINDTLSTSSFISTSSNTTPSATTLGTWLGSNDAFVETWFGITDNNTIDTGKRAIQTTTGKQPKFANSGVIATKNGNPAIDFLSDLRYLTTNALTALNSGNSFTVISVSALSTLDTVGVVCSNSINTTSNDSRFIHLNDNRTQKALSVLRNTSGAQYNADLLAQQNTLSQKLLTSVMNYPSALTSYYNGTIQDYLAVTGSWVNNTFTIGVQRNEATQLNGTMQELIIFPSDKTSDLATLHTEMNAYYSIY